MLDSREESLNPFVQQSLAERKPCKDPPSTPLLGDIGIQI